MAGGYDGSIKIDTKVDTSGVNEGTAKAGKALKGIGGALGGIGKVLSLTVLAAVGAVIAAVFAIGKAVAGAIKAMMKMEGFKEKFAEAELAFTNLQNAAYSALMPLMELLLPIIMQVVDWLTRAANVAAAFFAALNGSSTYMTYVASGMAKAGGSSGKYADNMERAEKAAKGSLASFDKINVLDKKETPEIKIPGGDGGGGAIGEWVEQSVEDTFASLSDGWRAFIDGLLLLFKDGDWSGLGDWFKEFVWEPVKAKAIEIWEQFKRDISDSWEEIKGWFDKNLVTPLKESWSEIKEWAVGVWTAIKEWAIQAWKDIKETWNAVGAWFDEKVIQPIKTFFSDAWNAIKTWVTEAWDKIKGAWQNAKQWFDEKVVTPIKNFFAENWNKIKEEVTQTWDKIKDAWQNAKQWFDEKVVTPIKNFFAEDWNKIKEKVTQTWDKIKDAWQNAKQWFDEKILNPIKEAFENIWGGISDFIKNIINGIIGFINGMIRGIVSGINAVIGVLNKLKIKIPDWVPGLGGKSIGFSFSPIEAPQIPLLATGAVIPPNSQFLAVLGDQKSGTNIEAPEALIRKIVREETGRLGNAEGTIHNVIKLDGQVLYDAFKKIDKRVGASLVAGSGIR